MSGRISLPKLMTNKRKPDMLTVFVTHYYHLFIKVTLFNMFEHHQSNCQLYTFVVFGESTYLEKTGLSDPGLKQV